MNIGNQFSATDYASITVSNTGSILSSAVGTNNQVGFINGPQFYGESGGGSFIAGDYLTMTATNSGTDEGTGSSSSVGYLNSTQIAFDNYVTVGNGLIMTISNSGIESGTGLGSNSVGYVNSNQFSANNTVTVGESAEIVISNSGSIAKTGNSSDSIGYVNGSQFAPNSDFVSNDSLTLTVTNSGTFQGTETSNNAGYLTGSQIAIGGNFYSGNDLNLTVSNSGSDSGSGHGNYTGCVESSQLIAGGTFFTGANTTITTSNTGTYTSSGSGSNHVGYVSDSQIYFAGAVSTGTNALIQATNTGSTNGEGSSNNIGVVTSSQISFNGTASFDDGSVISATNSGTGNIGSSQIYFVNGFFISSGKITLEATNSSQGTIGSYGIYVGDVSGGGDANIVLSNSSLYVSSTAPSFTLGGLNGDTGSTATCNVPLIINTDTGVTGVFNGALTCSSTLTKAGPGIQTLSGTLSITTGPVTVNDGTLIINGTLPVGLVINSPGIVGGNVTIDGALVVNGTVAPGNSIGTMDATTYTSNTGSFYDVEVNDAGESDLILASTSATIGGGSVVVSSSDGTFKFQSPYTIVSAPSITGTYSSVSAVTSMILPSLSYSSEHVYLTLTANTAAAARTLNQRTVAHQLDGIIKPNALQNLLLSEIVSLSLSDASSALDSISGWQFTDQALIAYGLNDQFITRLYDPIRSNVTSDQQRCECPGPNDYTFWSEVGGTTSKFNGNSNAHTFIWNGWQVTLGFQKTFSCDWLIGVASSFEQDYVHYKNHGGSSYNNTVFGGLYSLYRPSHFYTFADLAYGYGFNQLHRKVQVGSLSFAGKSHPNVSQFTFYGEIGADRRIKALLMQPFIGVEAGSYWQKSITESGVGGFALHVENKSSALATTKLGSHFTVGKLAEKLGSLSLDLSWNRQWTHNTYTINEEFINFGDSFAIKGLAPYKNAFYYALNWSKCINRRWQIHLKAEGNVWSHAYQIDGLAGLDYSW